METNNTKMKEFVEIYKALGPRRQAMIDGILSCNQAETDAVLEFSEYVGKLSPFEQYHVVKAAECVLVAKGWDFEKGSGSFLIFGMFAFGWMMGIRAERARRRAHAPASANATGRHVE